ncbi:MAG: flippase-like domain-containing protein [Deltaproteobacteria bacterium]|nr:flippase-like domain-containing protein [Deltaproteobacteria bacterium]
MNRRWVQIVGFVIICGATLLYILLFRDQTQLLKNVRISRLWLLLTASFVMVVTTGLTNALLVKILGVRLTTFEYSSLSFLTTFANYFGPLRAGAAVRATYLRMVKGLPISAYAGVMVANSLILFFVSGITGLSLLLAGYYYYGLISPELVLACLIFTGFAVAAKIVRLPSFKREGRIYNMFRLAATGLDTIRSQHLGLTEVILSILLQYIVAAFVIYAAYHAMGISIPLLPAFIIGVFNAMSGYLSITPNNLGLQEAAIGYLGMITGLGLNESLLAAALIRGGQVAVVFLLTPACWFWLLRPAGINIMGKAPDPHGDPS